MSAHAHLPVLPPYSDTSLLALRKYDRLCDVYDWGDAKWLDVELAKTDRPIPSHRNHEDEPSRQKSTDRHKQTDECAKKRSRVGTSRMTDPRNVLQKRSLVDR